MTALSRFDLGPLRARFAALTGRPGTGAEAVPVRDWVAVSTARPSRLLGFDQVLVGVVLALLALGIVMVYSASIALPDNP